MCDDGWVHAKNQHRISMWKLFTWLNKQTIQYNSPVYMALHSHTVVSPLYTINREIHPYLINAKLLQPQLGCLTRCRCLKCCSAIINVRPLGLKGRWSCSIFRLEGETNGKRKSKRENKNNTARCFASYNRVNIEMDLNCKILSELLLRSWEDAGNATYLSKDEIKLAFDVESCSDAKILSSHTQCSTLSILAGAVAQGSFRQTDSDDDIFKVLSSSF